MNTIGFKMGILALVAVAVVSLIPYIGWFLPAPIVALAIGAAAGRRAAATATNPNREAAKVGAQVGIGALLGSTIALAILALLVVNIPGVPEFIRRSEPHPEARIPFEWMAPLGALAGIVVGFLIGLFDLVLAIVGGFVAGWVDNHNRHVPV